jgi:hypothetical protein
MPESANIPLLFCALIPVISYAIPYAIGGRDKAPLFRPRIWKRIIAPVLFSSLVILLSVLSKKFSPWFLLSIPAYISAHFLMDYGDDKLWVKLLRRLWTGLIMCLAASSIALFAKSYILLACQGFLAVSAHTVLGLTNPVDAQYEELLISALTVIFVPFMVI